MTLTRDRLKGWRAVRAVEQMIERNRRPGNVRFVVVDAEGRPDRPVSYPTDEIARANCPPGCVVRRATVVGPDPKHPLRDLLELEESTDAP